MFPKVHARCPGGFETCMLRGRCLATGSLASHSRRLQPMAAARATTQAPRLRPVSHLPVEGASPEEGCRLLRLQHVHRQPLHDPTPGLGRDSLAVPGNLKVCQVPQLVDRPIVCADILGQDDLHERPCGLVRLCQAGDDVGQPTHLQTNSAQQRRRAHTASTGEFGKVPTSTCKPLLPVLRCRRQRMPSEWCMSHSQHSTHSVCRSQGNRCLGGLLHQHHSSCR